MGKWWQSTSADGVGTKPFFHPLAIDYLESLLNPNYSVCEFGGGGSTIWLADKVRSVTTYENNPSWYNEIEKLNLGNVKLLHDGIPSENSFDVAILDGEPLQLRTLWITAAMKIIKKNGIIVLDNANRPEYAEEKFWLETKMTLINRVNGNEPGTKYLVTEFYQWQE